MDRRLIEHFVNNNVLSRQDMQRIILRASKSKTGLVAQMLDAGVIDDESLAEQIAAFYNYEVLDSNGFFMDDSVLGMLDEESATQQGVLPYGYEPGSARVYVAVYEPDQTKEALAKIEAASGQPPVLRVAPRGWLENAIPFYYGNDSAGASLSGAPRNDTRSQNSWSQRPRSSGRTQSPNRRSSEGEFGSDMPMVSGMHRISPRVEQSPRSSARPMQSRSMAPSNDFDEFEALLRDDGPDLSPRASVIGRPRIARRNDDSSFGGFNTSQNQWDQQARPASSPNHSAWQNNSPSDHHVQEPPHSGSFSLFEEQPEEQTGQSVTLQEIVERHHQQINDLKSEAQRQREVIQALADLLIEARVLSRRDLTAKLQNIRKK